MMVPRCGRTGEIVEPTLSEQWYMAMSKPAPAGTRHPGKSIAQVALDVVARGDVRIFPEQWRTIYNQWLENIQDWCISRQLWWGHQIPAWYDEQRQQSTSRAHEAEAQAKAGCGHSALTRDPDVLDTWYSSAMVPFSTLGWPASSRRRRATSASPTTSTCHRRCWSPATTSSSSGSPA